MYKIVINHVNDCLFVHLNVPVLLPDYYIIIYILFSNCCSKLFIRNNRPSFLAVQRKPCISRFGNFYFFR